MDFTSIYLENEFSFKNNITGKYALNSQRMEISTLKGSYRRSLKDITFYAGEPRHLPR